MKKLLAIFVAFLFNFSPVLAAPQAGITLGSHSFSGPTRYHKLINCFVTDDVDQRVYSGSLLSGQTFSDSWAFCYHDDYTVDGVDEGVHEIFYFDMIAKGTPNVILTMTNRERSTVMPVTMILAQKRGYYEWKGCVTTNDSAGTIPYDEQGHVEAGGIVELRISGIVKDVSLLTTVETDSGNGCP